MGSPETDVRHVKKTVLVIHKSVNLATREKTAHLVVNNKIAS